MSSPERETRDSRGHGGGWGGGRERMIVQKNIEIPNESMSEVP